ncbi:MAG: lytic murein transglycosylase [Pseudorhodoplanes sp.]
MRSAIFAAILAAALLPRPADADPAFDRWLAAQWPEAQRLGVSRKTFEEATRNLQPDLSLPDLDLPQRADRAPPAQPEFVQTPADYLKESSLQRLAAHGRKLAQEHRAALAGIEKQSGIPGPVLLAIFGRETDFGRYRLPHNAVRVLATQGYVGRRRDQFRQEFLLALKILEEKHVPLTQMRSSWAGAMGLVQFLPSDFYRYAADFDGDGHKDIWNSVPDALASAAQQLLGKGWERGRRWAYEVRAPANADCSAAEPAVTRTVEQWLARGFSPLGRAVPPAERGLQASVLMPEGLHGPAFLTPKNYFVLKEYNVSDLYVLFVGNLADRIAGGGAFVTPWTRQSQLKTADVEAMQQALAQRGLYAEKIDGKAGMKTRAALGAYQKAHNLPLDCWPSRALLEHMRAGRR